MMNKIEKWLSIVLVTISIQVLVNGEMEGFIVHGMNAKTNEYPHAAFLAVMCEALWTCGSSILNQDIVITAAHCFENCPIGSATTVGVVAGNIEVHDKFSRFATEVKVHESYDQETIVNDIALIRLDRPLTLSINIKKVIIVMNPDLKVTGDIAGWGLIDEMNGITTHLLRGTTQRVWLRSECVDLLGSLPYRTFCAGDKNLKRGYTAVGDSGSGLVTKRHILIGLLSYKIPSISASVAIYTDVANYYTWIKRTSSSLYCQTRG